MAVNTRLILGSVLGCAVAYSGYSYYDRRNFYDDMEKNAKIKSVPGALTTGTVVPVKKGHFITGPDKKKHFVPDDVQPASSAVSPAATLPAAPAEPPPTALAVAKAQSTLASPLPASTQSAPNIQTAPPAPLPSVALKPVTNVSSAPQLKPAQPALPFPVPAQAAAAAQMPPPSVAGNALPKIPAPPIEQPALPVVTKPVESSAGKPEAVCDWKTGGSFANIRSGQNLFRFNLRADLDAKSSLLHHFEGHAKPTVVADESKLECGEGDCFVINSDLLMALTTAGLHDFKCGEWYLITDGPEEGCEKQVITHSLKISKNAQNHCVVGSLVDVRTTVGNSANSKNVTSSMYVTGTKPETTKPGTAARKADDE